VDMKGYYSFRMGMKWPLSRVALFTLIPGASFQPWVCISDDGRSASIDWTGPGLNVSCVKVEQTVTLRLFGDCLLALARLPERSVRLSTPLVQLQVPEPLLVGDRKSLHEAFMTRATRTRILNELAA